MKAYDLKDFIDEIRPSPSKIPPIQMLQVGPHLIPTVNSFHNLLSCLPFQLLFGIESRNPQWIKTRLGP